MLLAEIGPDKGIEFGVALGARHRRHLFLAAKPLDPLGDPGRNSRLVLRRLFRSPPARVAKPGDAFFGRSYSRFELLDFFGRQRPVEDGDLVEPAFPSWSRCRFFLR